MNTFIAILKYAAVFVLAIFVGSFAMIGLHHASGWVWPEFSIDVLPAEQDAIAALFDRMPLGPKVAIWLAHWGGTAAAAAAAMLASGRKAVWPGVVMGAWFTVGGITNNALLPAPVWLEAVDLVGYLPVAYAVSRNLVKPQQAAVV